MAGSVNKVILVRQSGPRPRGAHPAFRRPCRVLFARDHGNPGADKNSGERKDRTEWHNISIFNENPRTDREQYCRKGSKIYLEGQLSTREYTDKDGNQRKATDVVLQRFRGETDFA